VALRRKTVVHVRQKLNTSERRTCNVLGVARSTMTYQTKDRDEDALRHDIIRLAKMYGRYGYRKIAQLLGLSGWKVNHKKIERIWREEGLQLPERHKRKRRLYHKDSSIIRMRPNAPNHVWAIDFVHDKLSNNRPYKMLTVVDEYTRQALAVHVANRMSAADVLEALYPLLIRHGKPQHIRSDNVLYAELLADLASGHYRIEVSRHVHSMAQFGFLVNDSLSHNKHRVRFCGSHRP
jgi:putative transposase